MADPSDPPIFEAPRDVLAGGGRITQLNDRSGGRVADTKLVAALQSAKVEPAQREVFTNCAWVEVMTICVDAPNLLYAKQADRLLWSAVHRLLGALTITNQPTRCNNGAINRSLRNTTRVRYVDAGDLTATPRGKACDLSPSCGKVVYPTLLVPLRWCWRLTHDGMVCENECMGKRSAPEAKVAKSTWATKRGLAQMLKGGVIMDVVTPAEAKVAEEAGAVAVMALERVPFDIRRDGGVARMSDPDMIKGIQAAVSVPVMAKARIGHHVEAQILEALNVDYIDESEVLTPADDRFHINKHQFRIPFLCGCKDLGEALRRISEGAAMMRTKGEAGTGNIVEAVRHIRTVKEQIEALKGQSEKRLRAAAKEMRVPYELVKLTVKAGRLPVVNFVAGGIATPADAALSMWLGADGVFVGSGIFKAKHPAKMAAAIVQATTHWANPAILAEVSAGLGEAMKGIEMRTIPDAERLSSRGW